MQDKIKKIGIDARFYGPFAKGLGRYTQEIVDNILKIDTENNYVIFLGKHNFDELIIDKNNKRVKKVLVDIKWYSWKEQLLFPFYIWKEKLDLIHFTHFNVPIFCPVKFIVTIHDLILTKFKTVRATTKHPLIYSLKDFFYRVVIKSALKKSKKILTVSNFTKDDIVQQFKINPKKIQVIYEGVSNLSKGRDSLFVAKLNKEEVLSDYKISFPYFLYVGNAYPHKNLEFLVESFLKWNSKDNKFRLVMVGKEDFFYKRTKEYAFNLINKNNYNNSIIFTGYVPDDKLEIIYQRAMIYIFPSLYEGFGLPPLEALFNSCPVLSSREASMPEIIQNGALYFDPYDYEDFYNKLNLLVDNEKLRQNIIEQGKEVLKRYNWWECAYQTREAYFQSL
ncbi:MAG: glycosyltransferase family 1 protein [Patescibacteria group bacterium]|nr:glycosyltransferase family 4 protein [Patescibacteria group bacterium]